MSKKKNKKAKTALAVNLKNNTPSGKEIYRKIILYGWMFLLYFLPYLRGKTLVGGASKYFVSFTVITILAAIAVWGMIKGKLSWPRHSFIKPIVFYLLVLIVTTITSIDPLSSLFGMYPDFHTGIIAKIMCIVFFYLILISQPTKEEIKSFLKIFTVIGICIGVHTIFITCGWFNSIPIADGAGRAIGIFQNSDFTLSYLLFIMPLVIYHRNQEKQPIIKTLYAVSIGILIYDFFILIPSELRLIIVNILVSSTGTFIVISMAILTLIIYLCRKQILTFLYKVGYKKILGIALALLIIISAAGYTILKQPITAFLTDQANAMRWWAWEAGINNGKNHLLLGTGPGTVSYFLPQYQIQHPLSFWDYHISTNNLHNETMDAFATMGILGLLSYLLLWGLMFYNLIKAIQQNNSEKKLLTALLFSLILFFGFNQLLFVTLGTMFLPWLALAIILILTEQTNYIQKAIFKPIIKIILSLTIIAVSSFLVYWNSRYWLAEYYNGKAIDNQSDYNYFKKSAALFPYNDRYLLSYGYYNYFDNIVIKKNILGQKFSKQEEDDILIDSSRTLKRAVEMKPQSSVNWANYGAVQLAMKNIDKNYTQKAEYSFSKATKLNAANPLLAIKISEGYQNVGDFANAKKYLDRAIKLKDAYTTIDTYMAYCKFYLRQNDQNNAFLMFRKARKAGLSYDSDDGKYYLKYFRDNKK